MNCQHCGHHNQEQAKFCNECGARLAPAVTTAALLAQPKPADYTPRHLVERILNDRHTLLGERKWVTVLFADVVDSMTLAETVGADAWHGILDRFFRILGEAIHGFGGTINQFTGDGVMALFGAPIAREDHAQRACHAALAVSEALAEFRRNVASRHGVEMRARMGLNSGEVVVGRIGDDLRMDYTAQGHAVGLAARVERLAGPGEINLTGNTAQLVEGYFELSDLGAHALPGSQQPVPVYRLDGPGPLRTRLDVAGARGFSPFVGRETTLRSLEQALARAADGGGLVVGLEGAAGIGKSRAALEFARRCRNRGTAVFQAHCPSYGQSVPLLPIRGLLTELLGLDPDGDEAGKREQLAKHPIFADPAFEPSLPGTLEILGLDPPTARPGDRATSERQAATAEMLAGLIRRHTAEQPGLVVIDDIHWIDPESEWMLERIIELIPDSRALLLLIFRSDSRAPWMDAPHYRQIGLVALDDSAQHELLVALLGSDPSLEGLPARMLADTAGNPLFIEELLRVWVDIGALDGAPGAYRLVDPDAPVDIPATLQPILAARIDRLNGPDKELLQMAAVIGRQFELPILRRVAEAGGLDVQASLARLEAAGFLHRRSLNPAAPWFFHHALVRDVAYNSLLTDRRLRLHADIAVAIEQEGKQLGERANWIAYHWDAAERPNIAKRWRYRAHLMVKNLQPRGSARPR